MSWEKTSQSTHREYSTAQADHLAVTVYMQF